MYCPSQHFLGYLPYGPQTDVDLATVTNGGWTLCHQTLYSAVTHNDLDAIRNTKCTGPNLMLACRQTNSQTIQLLAWAPRDDVFHDAGTQSNPTPHNVQGSNWYFSDNHSWGFAREGLALNRNVCDNHDLATDDKRLSWHTDTRSGHRCGTNMKYEGNGYEKLIFTTED